jgi:hypothetical protein
LAALSRRGYRFTAPGNDTYRRVRLRPVLQGPPDLRGIFGWNRSFSPLDLEPELLALMRAGGALVRRGPRLVSRLRVASVGATLLLHSGWPPRARDAVFLGPDTYRFADLIAAEAPRRSPGLIVDIGAGSGAGGILAATRYPEARLVMTDINPKALRLARINAAHAGVAADTRHGEGLAGLDEPIDLALANPPFIAGAGGRAYRDGGGALGAAVTLAWTAAVLPRLAPGGRFILYTGAAIAKGSDPLRARLEAMTAEAGYDLRYREIDPDIFGGLLWRPDYWTVERIAAIGAVIDRPR